MPRERREAVAEWGYSGIRRALLDVDWNDIKIALAVIRAGSFAKAADLLAMTQPTVSKRIGALEKKLKLTLFNRTPYGAQLTLDGQRFSQEVEVAERSLRMALKRGGVGGGNSASVRLNVSDGFGSYWLAPFLVRMLDGNPGLSLSMKTPSLNLAQGMEDFDVIVHNFAPENYAFVTRRLGTLHFVPSASPGYLKQYGIPGSIDELKHHRVLTQPLYIADKGTWSVWTEGIVSNRDAAVETSSWPMLGEMALAGAGIGVFPTYSASLERPLVGLDLGLDLKTPLWLSYRKEARERPEVRLLADTIIAATNPKIMPWFAEDLILPNVATMAIWRETRLQILQRM